MAGNDEEDKSLAGRLKGKVQDVQSSITDALAGASEASVEKLKGAVTEVNELLPLIRELGYSVDGINVGIGLVPDVSISISGLTKTMDEALYRRILDEHKEDRILCGVLIALQSASAIQGKLQFLGMASDTCAITLGLPPKVSLHFKRTT
jgi:hypothetical protein